MSLSSTGALDIYMARVGQSTSMEHGILAGNQINDTPLSEKGKKGAQAAGDNLVTILENRQVQKVQIWTSGEIARMKQTTNLIIEKLNEAKITSTLHSDNRLGGKNHGIFNASTKEERRNKTELVAEKAKRNEMTPEQKFMIPVEGGESKYDIATKTSQLLQEIYQAPRLTNCIVVVASNNALKALTARLNEKKPYNKMPVGHPEILHLQQSAKELKFIEILKA